MVITVIGLSSVMVTSISIPVIGVINGIYHYDCQENDQTDADKYEPCD